MGLGDRWTGKHQHITKAKGQGESGRRKWREEGQGQGWGLDSVPGALRLGGRGLQRDRDGAPLETGRKENKSLRSQKLIFLNEGSEQAEQGLRKAELWQTSGREAPLAVEGGLRRDKEWEGKGEHGSCPRKAGCPRQIRRWGRRGGRGGRTERRVATAAGREQQAETEAPGAPGRRVPCSRHRTPHSASASATTGHEAAPSRGPREEAPSR